MEQHGYARSVGSLRTTLTDRLKRHDMPAYVYTYPPKGAYRSFTDSDKVREAWANVTGPVNLYVHVPYCEMKCSFCSLFATTSHSEDTLRRYVAGLLGEMELVGEFVNKAELEVHSVYFGGGTPTILSTEQLSTLLDHLVKNYRFHSSAEFGIEAAPNSIDEEKCRELKNLGFNRLSLGVQSFEDDELKAMGRNYGTELGGRMTTAALEAGFPNVNIDLIYGLPEQTEQSWQSNLATAARLGVPTVTLYPLVVRAATRYGKLVQLSSSKFPDSENRYFWYDLAVDYLESEHYSQHTFVTFAQNGKGCRHEANEFVGIPTLGIGAAARSYTPTLHYTSDDYFESKSHTTILNSYVADIENGRLPIRSGVELERDEVQRRYVILNLLYLGLDKNSYESRFGEHVKDRFGPELEALKLEGCLIEEREELRLSPRGKRYSSLIADFLTSDKVKETSLSYK